MSLKIREMAKGGETRDELLALVDKPKFEDGRTKQSFKDSCDINKMLKKAQQAGSLSHLLKYPEAVYGDFDGEFDLLTAQGHIERANKIFADLPSEVRNEFDNNALAFVQFAGDPQNNERLRELLPAIAEPGPFFPNPVQRGGQGAGAATAPSEAAAAGTEPESPPPAPTAETPVDTGDTP